MKPPRRPIPYPPADLPVTRRYLINGKPVTQIDPEWERQFRERSLARTEHNPNFPSWRTDPTYNLRRPKCPAPANAAYQPADTPQAGQPSQKPNT